MSAENSNPQCLRWQPWMFATTKFQHVGTLMHIYYSLKFPTSVLRKIKYSLFLLIVLFRVQKQPLRSVLSKTCSKNMQQIYSRTPMPKCDFNNLLWNFIEITLRHGFSTVNLLHIFRIPFLRTPLDGYFWELFQNLMNPI